MEEKFKVKVDASSGIVEVEGPESFVREMLERYASLTEQAPRAKAQATHRRPKSARKSGGHKEAGAAAKPKRKTGGPVEVDQALKQELQQHSQPLNAYLADRNLASQKEEAAAIAGFLSSNLDRATMDDIEYVTVLRIMGKKLPKNPRQVLIDAKNKMGFFFEDGTSFGLSTTGINFVEHDSLKVEHDSLKKESSG